MSTYEEIESRLAELGHSMPVDLQPFAAALVDPGMPRGLREWRDLDEIFEAVAVLSDEPQNPSFMAKWRLPALAALFDAIDFRNATLKDAYLARTADRELLPRWLRATARAHGIDLRAAAGQATSAIAEKRSSRERPDPTDVVMAAPSTQPPAEKAAIVDEQDLAALLDTLTASADWFFDVAGPLLRQSRLEAVSRTALLQLPPLPRRVESALPDSL